MHNETNDFLARELQLLEWAAANGVKRMVLAEKFVCAPRLVEVEFYENRALTRLPAPQTSMPQGGWRER